jgi:hypothetical protein
MATIDLTQITNLLNQLLPLIIVLAILPAIFKMIEKVLA